MASSSGRSLASCPVAWTYGRSQRAKAPSSMVRHGTLHHGEDLGLQQPEHHGAGLGVPPGAAVTATRDYRRGFPLGSVFPYLAMGTEASGIGFGAVPSRGSTQSSVTRLAASG